MDTHLISYYIGILVLTCSAIYNLVKPGMTMKTYSYINLAAVVMIAYYFMNKENFIKF